MRTLLINSNRFKQPWPVVPFGLLCVASAAEAAGHDVHVLDLCFTKDPGGEIRAAVRGFRPDVVGVSVRNIDTCSTGTSFTFLESIRDGVIGPLKQVFSGPLVIGGPAVGISAAEMLGFFDVEYAIRGDGEAAFVEFMRRISTDESMDGLGGLVIRRNGVITQNSPPMCVEDLDSLPETRAGNWIDLEPYRRSGSPLQIQTKRGCALSCTYCTYRTIEGQAWRLRSPQKVAGEIESLIRETGIRDIEFTDSTFNLPLAHAKSVLREIVARGIRASFRTMGLNPGAMDEELVDLLKASGFRDVDVGAEAGCDSSLRSLGKNFRKEALGKAGRLLRERGIPANWFLLVGAPAETRESLAETFETINQAASPWDLVTVGVGIRVYKGSAIAGGMKADGLVPEGEDFLQPVEVTPAGVSLEEISVLTKREALRRPNYFRYGADSTTPLFLLVFGTWLFRLLRLRQPIWRAYILLRKSQMWIGVGFLRRVAFEFFNRKTLFPSGRNEPVETPMRSAAG